MYLWNFWVLQRQSAIHVCFVLHSSAAHSPQPRCWLYWVSGLSLWVQPGIVLQDKSFCLLRGDTLHLGTMCTCGQVGSHHYCRPESQEACPAALQQGIQRWLCFEEGLGKSKRKDQLNMASNHNWLCQNTDCFWPTYYMFSSFVCHYMNNKWE